MTRAARITVENGCYYITTRSNQKQTVFAESADYEKYLHLLAKYRERYKFKLYCFCIMATSVHIIMQVKNPAKLNKIMQSLNISYAQYFNLTYSRVGFVWHDRFRSKIIGDEAYLLAYITHVEANPVRAGLVQEPQEYPWSSANLKINGSTLLDGVFEV